MLVYKIRNKVTNEWISNYKYRTTKDESKARIFTRVSFGRSSLTNTLGRRYSGFTFSREDYEIVEYEQTITPTGLIFNTEVL
jgi:hypothetical protein